MVQMRRDVQESASGALADEGIIAKPEGLAARPEKILVDRSDPDFWTSGVRTVQGDRTSREDVRSTISKIRIATKAVEKQELDVHSICPVCESTAVNIRCKLVCPNCHTIVQACCD